VLKTPFGMALEPMALPCLTMLFQNAYDLVFGEPAALQPWPFQLGHSPSQTGLRGGGNVGAVSVLQRIRRRDEGLLTLASCPSERTLFLPRVGVAALIQINAVAEQIAKI